MTGGTSPRSDQFEEPVHESNLARVENHRLRQETPPARLVGDRSHVCDQSHEAAGVQHAEDAQREDDDKDQEEDGRSRVPRLAPLELVRDCLVSRLGNVLQESLVGRFFEIFDLLGGPHGGTPGEGDFQNIFHGPGRRRGGGGGGLVALLRQRPAGCKLTIHGV
eukprot:CAMPEP_0172026048 /NCGR_PEP_ID=MMETSP1041-20130122/16226_1 /TAXON_ID=464988 /ORGANISM="Hemiselmis andersenii, Strain CCMP439" /LENGTH=163 /DNA_ID=CAMNT_0012681791 /DNA_START=41 /DNA_END=533 /DNA_ORIENTATION=+